MNPSATRSRPKTAARAKARKSAGRVEARKTMSGVTPSINIDAPRSDILDRYPPGPEGPGKVPVFGPPGRPAFCRDFASVIDLAGERSRHGKPPEQARREVDRRLGGTQH